MTDSRPTICYLINQNLPLANLITIIQKQEQQKPVLVVYSHELFPHEKETLVRQIPNCTLKSIADILCGKTQAWADQQASRSLTGLHKNPTIEADFARYQMDLSCRLKNNVLYDVLLDKYLKNSKQLSFFHCSGLGFHDFFWKSVGSVLIETPVLSDPAIGQQSQHFYLIDQGIDRPWLFLSPINRLHLADNCHVKKIPMPPNIASGHIHNTLADINMCVAKAIGTGVSWQPVTTIHGYRPWMSRMNRKLEICVDGYHPANYPRSYIDAYPRTAIIKTNDPISVLWFQKFGYHVAPDLRLQQPKMQLVKNAHNIHTVIVALNHAGDWSSVINRCDTDRLIMGALELAKTFPQLSIIVRAHPTMANSAHEGVGAFMRIQELIDTLKLANFSLSTVSLDTDFERGDLFISEYSQVLIDAWRLGKLGIAANLTGRASFLQTFVEMGFPEVSNNSSLISAIKQALDRPEKVLSTLRSSQKRYNLKLKEYVS